MRIFVAGATGVVGRRLVPLLVSQGHEVTGLARSAERAATLEAMGASAEVADPLDRAQLTAAVRRARPEVVIHQLTALAGFSSVRRLDRELVLTNRFRTEVTDTLVAAARDAGAGRFLAQSFCGWLYAREGGPVKTEEDPVDSDPPASFRQSLAAFRRLEAALAAADGLEALTLRYGFFYGPGTVIGTGGSIVEAVRKRAMPVAGGGGGVWSFIHVDDVAGATAAAVTRGAPGVYNIVDDEPATVATWLPAMAEALGAKPPRRVPAWVGRLVVGDGGLMMMTRTRGASNVKAKRELGWSPTWPTWRKGFVEGLG